MATALIPLSPHYLAYAQHLRELHALILCGEGDSDRADEVRDAMDGPWNLLSPEEANLARLLSADLDTIGHEVSIEPGQESSDELGRHEIEQARAANDWEQALRLLREHPNALPPSEAAVLRCQCWHNLGDRYSALFFWEDAVRLDATIAEKDLIIAKLFCQDGLLEEAARYIILAFERGSPAIPDELARVCEQFLQVVERARIMGPGELTEARARLIAALTNLAA